MVNRPVFNANYGRYFSDSGRFKYGSFALNPQ